MDKSIYVDAVEKANCALELQRRIVGVRFLFSQEEFDRANAPKPSARFSYCKMVTKATQGKAMKVDVDNFGCFAAARVLGIVELDDWYTSGHYYGNCGLYEDFPTGKEVTDHMSMCGHKAFGLEIKPLEEFEIAPHVVITVSNPFSIMRLIQGYSYKFGTHDSYKFIGGQAMCSESTAQPYKTNDINISLLCAGARRSGLNEDELAVGITLAKFVAMVDGLCKTITPVETNARKKRIQENFDRVGISEISIIPNTSYGEAMHKYDHAHFIDGTS